MRLRRLSPLLGIALLAAPALHAGETHPSVEVGLLAIPTFGHEYKGLTGFGLSFAGGAEHDFKDGNFDEFALGQLEGLYLHGSGANSIGGARHTESLDAGFAFVNLGFGVRHKNWTFVAIAGTGLGGGDLHGELARGDTALDTAIQFKPRLVWRASRHWSWFAEYRFLASSSVYGDFFNHDARALRLHAIGLGVVHRF